MVYLGLATKGERYVTALFIDWLRRKLNRLKWKRFGRFEVSWDTALVALYCLYCSYFSFLHRSAT